MKPPCVVSDGLSTGLMYEVRGTRATVLFARPDGLWEDHLAPNELANLAILSDYPVRRWVELHFQNDPAIVLPRSAKRVLASILADPNHEYTLKHFTKEFIMATAKAAGEAAAKKTSAKAANAAKAPADKPAKGKAAAADKAPAKPAAAPAKQAAKPAKAEATEGRRGRPSGLDEAAKIKKGSVDFKEHVRAETVRFALMKAIVDGVGKTIGDVLGQKIDDDHVIKSVDVRFAIENQYIAI